MIDVVLLVFFCVMAYRVAMAVRRERAILAEFNQSPVLGTTALLFPVGPIATFYLLGRSPILALIAGLICYLPSMLIARRMTRSLERAGTDRVHRAMSAASQAFGTSLVGLIYAFGAFLFVVIVRVYFSSADA
jgi:hypothetical protein